MIDAAIRDMEEKVERGTKQIRCTTVLATLREIKAEADRREEMVQGVIDRLTRERNEAQEARPAMNAVSANAEHVGVLDLLGTKEAAEALGVDRSRIGRYQRAGKMPTPVAQVGAAKLWTREQIESIRPMVEASRRNYIDPVAARQMIEAHPEVTAAEVAEKFGITEGTVRKAVEDGRIPAPADVDAVAA